MTQISLNTINLLDPPIQNLQIHLLTKTDLEPQSQYSWYFSSCSWACAEWWKIPVADHTSSQLRSDKVTLGFFVSALQLR